METIRRSAIYATNFDKSAASSAGADCSISTIARGLADRTIGRAIHGQPLTRELLDYPVMNDYLRPQHSPSSDESRWTVFVGDQLIDNIEVQIVVAWLQHFAPGGRPDRFLDRVTSLRANSRSNTLLESMTTESASFQFLAKKVDCLLAPVA